MSFTEREKLIAESLAGSLTKLYIIPETKSLVEEYCSVLVSDLSAEEKGRRWGVILEKISKIVGKTGKKSK